MKTIETYTETKTTFIDDEYLKATYSRDLNLVHFVWKKRAVGDFYRNAFMDAVEFTRCNRARYFLSDISKQGIISPNDRKWFEFEAIPKAVENGLRKVGTIVDSNTFKTYYLNILAKRFKEQGVSLRYFKSEGSAMDWLLDDEEYTEGKL